MFRWLSKVKQFILMFAFLFVLKHLVRHSEEEAMSVVEEFVVKVDRKMLEEEKKLVLLWSEYQMLGKDIYSTIFKRITNGQCMYSNCRFMFILKYVIFCVRFTTDRSLQNQSSAIIFHMPNLHWANYSFPSYRYD